jgi:hypothetical protein
MGYASRISGMVLRWRRRATMNRASAEGNIIDAEYRIVDRER